MTDTQQTQALTDDFRGDNAHLIRSIEALISLSDEGALVPHGIGGHARGLLSAAAVRLGRAAPQPQGGALTLDRDAVFAEMYKRDPYWDTQDRSSAAAVRLALECATTLATPTAPQQAGDGLTELINAYGRACRRDGSPAWESNEGRALKAALAAPRQPGEMVAGVKADDMREVSALLNRCLQYIEEDQPEMTGPGIHWALEIVAKYANRGDAK